MVFDKLKTGPILVEKEKEQRGQLIRDITQHQDCSI